MSRYTSRKRHEQSGICALCKGQDKLCMSHIIPEFLYKPLYDSNHRFHGLSTAKDSKHEILQKGVRGRLLCVKCEGKFSKYERYARGVLYGGEEILAPTKVKHGFVCQVDYTRFKLFQMSLIWRAGVSSISAFKDVTLGEYESRLRDMLLNEIPGRSEEYGCLLAWPTNHQNIIGGIIMHLEKLDFEGTVGHLFVMAGMLWLFVLSSKPGNLPLKQCFLQDSGELRILYGDLGLGLDLCVKTLVRDIYQNNLDVFSKGV